VWTRKSFETAPLTNIESLPVLDISFIINEIHSDQRLTKPLYSSYSLVSTTFPVIFFRIHT